MNALYWASLALAAFGGGIWAFVKTRRMTWDHLFDWVIIPSVAFVLAVAGVMFVILWYEPPPISAYQREVEPTIVRPNTEVFIRSSVTRSKAGCPSHVRRWFNDASGNKLGAHERDVPDQPAGHEEFRSSVLVPANASPGILVLHVEVEFFCNFVQRRLGGSRLLLPDVYLKVEGL